LKKLTSPIGRVEGWIREKIKGPPSLFLAGRKRGKEKSRRGGKKSGSLLEKGERAPLPAYARSLTTDDRLLLRGEGDLPARKMGKEGRL